MKKINRFLTLLILTFSTLLVGCGTKIVYVDKLQYVIKTPPESLLKDCPIEQPPEPAAFVKMEPEDRETELARLSAAQYKNLAVCNTDKRKLRAWSQEQKALEKKANDERPK